MKVNHIKLRSVKDNLFLHQKREGSKIWCNHLKKIIMVQHMDYIQDEVMDYPTCSLCGHIMDKKDIEIRNRKLRNFKKGKEVGEAVGEALKKL